DSSEHEPSLSVELRQGQIAPRGSSFRTAFLDAFLNPLEHRAFGPCREAGSDADASGELAFLHQLVNRGFLAAGRSLNVGEAQQTIARGNGLGSVCKVNRGGGGLHEVPFRSSSRSTMDHMNECGNENPATVAGQSGEGAGLEPR